MGGRPPPCRPKPPRARAEATHAVVAHGALSKWKENLQALLEAEAMERLKPGEYQVCIVLRQSEEVSANALEPGLCDISAVQAATTSATEAAADPEITLVQFASADGLLFVLQPMDLAGALFVASTCGCLPSVQQLLALDAEKPRLQSEHTGLAFVTACSQGHLEIVHELLALTGVRQVDVHAQGDGGLLQACYGGHVAVVKVLLALDGERAPTPDIVTDDAVSWTSSGGHVSVLRELLALRGAYLVPTEELNTALASACCHGHLDMMQLLLDLEGDRAVDVNAMRGAPFGMACTWGQLEAMRLLLALTGDRTVDVRARDDYALRVACDRGRFEVARELLALPEERRPALTWRPPTNDPDDAEDGLTSWFAQRDFASCRELLCLAPCAFTVDMPLTLLVAQGDLRRAGRLPVGISECILETQAALQQCGDAASQSPALARQVAQQVLMHALDGAARTLVDAQVPQRFMRATVQLLQQYCALLAALPAAECAPLRDALQRQTADALGANAQRAAAVWCGVSLPFRAAQHQVEEPGLRQALVRAGRGRAVLHRVAAQRAQRTGAPQHTRR